MNNNRAMNRRARVAAHIGFAIYMALFAGMFVGSQLLHKEPTARWCGLLAPAQFVMAADLIVNRRWHSRKVVWGVKRTSQYCALGGIWMLMFAAVLTFAGIASWSMPWFSQSGF
jgi:hypothetical protein